MFKILRRKIRTAWRLTYNAMYNRPIGYIYMFHMVKPKEDYIAAIDSLRVSPEYFEKFLIEKMKQIDFVSIDEVPLRIKTQKRGQKPFGVVTFDDGYDDNFTDAYPILKKLHIPFVIYVSVNLVNDHAPIWNYPLIIERIIRKNAKLRLGNGDVYMCGTEEEKDETYKKLRLILFAMPYEKLQAEFEKLFGGYLKEYVFPKNTLTWEQIEQLAKDPLCTIGAHTMSHSRLTISDKEFLSYELGSSKAILEQHIGKPVHHMAYPYGSVADVADEAKSFAKNIGYQTAVMAGGGPLRKKDNEIGMYSLKRIQVYDR